MSERDKVLVVPNIHIDGHPYWCQHHGGLACTCGKAHNDLIDSLRQRLADLRGENNALKCQIEGDHCAMCPDVKRLREALERIIKWYGDDDGSYASEVCRQALSGKGEGE